ncbi:retinol-binding protein 5-like, partial [Sceloporus undulatus]|uniref:retinol-binding protein 5-like n=1 Tax=Sceloporus undulatus TaxID=8520 RepID=UPI001C4B7DC8
LSLLYLQPSPHLHHQTIVYWEGDQLVCEQKGEKQNRGWRHWLEGDRLHLRMTAEDEVCVQVFQKVK